MNVGFLGAAARGANQGLATHKEGRLRERAAAVQDKELGLKERALDQDIATQESAAKTAEAQRHEKFIGLAIEAVKQAQQNNKATPEFIANLETGIAPSIKALDAINGSGKPMLTLFHAAASGTPTPQEAAQSGATAKVAGMTALRDELMGVGVPDAQAAQLAGLVANPKVGDSEFERNLAALNLSPEQEKAARLKRLEHQTTKGGGVNVDVTLNDGKQPLTTGERGKTQRESQDLAGRLQKVRNISASLDGEGSFLKIGKKLELAIAQGKESLGADLDDQTQQELEDYAFFRAEAGELFSQTLAEISGAAVSPSEAKRSEVWLPNPGTGLFDGDSPTVFKSKVKRMEGFIASALLRQQMFLSEDGVSLENVSRDIPLFANHPKSGKRVFFSDFMKAAQDANPGVDAKAIADKWKQKYGG